MPEERLQYGFRRTPTNQQVRKHFPNIAEERLQAVDRTVVELKAVRRDQFEEQSDEEELFEDDAADTVDNAPSHLGLGDIGYGPARSHEPRFEARRCDHAAVQASCNDPQPAEAIGNCGFRRGELVLEASHHHPASHGHGAAAADRVIEFNLAAGQYDSSAYDRFRRNSASDANVATD